jgi:hypothetical protein
MYDLDVACIPIRKAFGPPYLVGSSGIDGRRDYRDVDVRLILEDAEFDDLMGDEPYRWELLSLAIGDYLRLRTRLPVDFQIQRQSEANERHSKPRNPLGMGRNLAGGGDATPWTPPKSTPELDELGAPVMPHTPGLIADDDPANGQDLGAPSSGPISQRIVDAERATYENYP